MVDFEKQWKNTIKRIFNIIEEDPDDYLVIIDDEHHTVQKWILKLLDDSPLVDIPKWLAQERYYYHHDAIKKEGGFMDD